MLACGVRDLERAVRASMSGRCAPLGMSRLVTRPATVGFGKSYPEFWINLRADMSRFRSTAVRISVCGRNRPPRSTHFTRRRSAAGGRSDGAPGLRPQDRVRYYAAFIVDPDGNRIEAVTFPAIESPIRLQSRRATSGASSLLLSGSRAAAARSRGRISVDAFGLENIDA